MKNKLLILPLIFLSFHTAAYARLPPVFQDRTAKDLEKDPRTRIYLSPQRIVWQSDESGKYISDAKNLLKPGNGQAELVNKDLVTLKSDGKVKSAILLDYGKELHGGLQLVTGMMKENKPVKVRIRFGESASEAMAEIDTIKGATNDHAIRDFVVELPWLGALELGNTGFRFVRIDLLEENTELLLKEVRAVFIFRDVPFGSFKSNDERLNQVWATGAYTVHLNMQQYLLVRH